MVQSNGQQPLRVLDFELFQELWESLGNDLGIVASLYKRFLGNTAATLVELRQSGAARPGTLHALKGSASMVGANRIAAVANDLQELLLHAPRALADAELDSLDAELTLFRVAITDHLQSLGHTLTP